MAADNLGLPMTFGGMAHGVVANDLLANFAMMPGSFSGKHVSLSVDRRVASDIGSADIANRDFLRAVDRNLLCPGSAILHPDELRVLYLFLCRLRCRLRV